MPSPYREAAPWARGYIGPADEPMPQFRQAPATSANRVAPVATPDSQLPFSPPPINPLAREAFGPSLAEQAFGPPMTPAMAQNILSPQVLDARVMGTPPMPFVPSSLAQEAFGPSLAEQAFGPPMTPAMAQNISLPQLAQYYQPMPQFVPNYFAQNRPTYY